jgi:uncharacterized lipoprotein
VNRTSTLRWSILVLLCASSLGGCSWFHHRTDYYSKAAEARPLDVPPDLDTPVTSNELIVPAATTPGTAAAATPANALPPAASASSIGTSTALTGDGLHVADSPDHAWQRVGLALERAQVGTISGRDETARSYTLEVSGLGAPPAAAPAEEHHWYTRILHPFGGGGSSSSSQATAQTVSGHLTVRVSQDKDGARVNVEGDSTDSATATAARRVLEVLRERLS